MTTKVRSQQMTAPLFNGSASRVPKVPDFDSQDVFLGTLQAEVRRTERTGRPCVLMLAEAVDRACTEPGSADALLLALTRGTRATDVRGWYRDGSVLGIVFTEADAKEVHSAVAVIEARMRAVLAETLTLTQLAAVSLKFLVFPDGRTVKGSASEIEEVLQRESTGHQSGRGAAMACKRIMDIAGSLGALILAAPVFVVIALMVRFSSKGPILFRQSRVGENGGEFTFLKFRSMYAANNPAIHQEYVKNLIKGKETAGPAGEKVYKIVNDPRITPVGRVLRRTSLDEIPQFINVLKGDMSLVGPRPPIPYELEHYQPWHRQRLTAKPGITGLWQVQGRSRTTFDEMVRLDVQYVRSWTVWMDLRILFQTPKAVLTGNGAH